MGDYLIGYGYKIYYRPQAVVHHKRSTRLLALWRRKYLLGLSSIWYRKKQNKFFMFKRHFILLIALFCLPFLVINKIFLFQNLFSHSGSALNIIGSLNRKTQVLIEMSIFSECQAFIGSCIFTSNNVEIIINNCNFTKNKAVAL